jgi:hypothetical protein
MSFLGSDHEASRMRASRDATFNMLVQIVCHSLESGETSIQDWKEAVNYAATEYHLRHVGPVIFPKEAT